MQHFGYVVPVQEETGFEAFAVICKVLKGRPTQPSFLRNGIKSRKVTGFEGHNIKVEQVLRLQEIGSDEELLKMAHHMPSVLKHRNQRKAGKQKLTAHLHQTKMSDPVYNALNEAYVFNLSLEVATVYNLCQFVDHSTNEELTSSRLRSNVLYLETKSTRYELARFTDESFKQIYRLSVVKDAHLKDNEFFA